ncbi:MAG: DUF1553 domain-containing protein, partial [Verrucomicrobiota bacterium]
AKIRQLLNDERHPRFWSEIWTAMLNGYSNAFETDRVALQRWIESELSANRPYDQMVTQLITATGPSSDDGAVNFIARYRQDAAVRVSRMFLGVRLDCARCHDHPFDRWTEDDFQNMSRFFQATRREGGERNPRLIDEVRDGGNRPVFLTGATPRTTRWRDEFALFVTHTNAFAKNFANRIWYQLLGRGIVNPPDDFNEHNQPSVPALLDHLATTAKESECNIRSMIEQICLSEAYQRSSAATARRSKREEVFALRVVKPLTIEQLVDSLQTCVRWQLREPREIVVRRLAGGEDTDIDFSETWKYRETVQQLMGRLAMDLRAPSTNLDEIFLGVLTRRPTETERAKCAGFSPTDIAFALVNTNEFYFNH